MAILSKSSTQKNVKVNGMEVMRIHLLKQFDIRHDRNLRYKIYDKRYMIGIYVLEIIKSKVLKQFKIRHRAG